MARPFCHPPNCAFAALQSAANTIAIAIARAILFEVCDRGFFSSRVSRVLRADVFCNVPLFVEVEMVADCVWGARDRWRGRFMMREARPDRLPRSDSESPRPPARPFTGADPRRAPRKETELEVEGHRLDSCPATDGFMAAASATARLPRLTPTPRRRTRREGAESAARH